MEPKRAMLTIYNSYEEDFGPDPKGHGRLIRTVRDDKQVVVKVWPVAMGANDLLVEHRDGSLSIERVHDLRILEET